MRHRIAALVLLAACNGDDGTGGKDGSTPTDNETPTPDIWSHEDGQMVLEGWTLELGGSAVDDGPTEELVGTWSVDGQQLCTGPFDENDNSTCSWTVPTATQAVIRFEVADTWGATGSTEITVSIRPNDPPLIEILAPIGGNFPSGQPVALEGRAYDVEDSPGQLVVTWESSLDGALSGVDTMLDPYGNFAGEATLSPGSHTLTATVEDQAGGSASDSVDIVVTP